MLNGSVLKKNSKPMEKNESIWIDGVGTTNFVLPQKSSLHNVAYYYYN